MSSETGKSEPVTVRILDREYTVGVSDGERASLTSAARLLDQRMRLFVDLQKALLGKFAFLRMLLRGGEQIFSSFFHEERLLVIALQVGYIYTAHVVKDYLNLRKPLYSLLTPEEKKALNSYVSIGDLENYIHTLRAEYEKNPFAL